MNTTRKLGIPALLSILLASSTVVAQPDEPVEPEGKDGGEFCEEDSDCKSKECTTDRCTDYEGGKKGPKLWVGVFGAIVLFVSIPILRPIVLNFRSPEFFMLALLGLTMVGSLSGSGLARRA